MVSENKVAKI